MSERHKESDDPLASRLAAGCAALDLALPVRTQATLLDYVAELVLWNRAYSLTAVRDPAQAVTLHLLDSLSVVPFLHGERVIDVGSGAGLPGLVLAVAQPQRHFVLLDANGKKVAFMRHAVRRLALGNVEVVQARAESYCAEMGFDSVITRAFASLADMMRLGGHLCVPSGRFLAMKGRFPAQEVASVPDAFRLLETRRLCVPGLEAQRHLLIFGCA